METPALVATMMERARLVLQSGIDHVYDLFIRPHVPGPAPYHQAADRAALRRSLRLRHLSRRPARPAARCGLERAHVVLGQRRTHRARGHDVLQFGALDAPLEGRRIGKGV